MTITEDNCGDDALMECLSSMDDVEVPWYDGLSTRAVRVVTHGVWSGDYVDEYRVFTPHYNSKAELMDAFVSGKFYPSEGGKPASHRQYGWKTHKEIAAWLGLPEPMKPKPGVPLMQKVESLTYDMDYLLQLTSMLLNDLPTNRDWLDPNLESTIKATVKELREKYPVK